VDNFTENVREMLEDGSDLCRDISTGKRKVLWALLGVTVMGIGAVVMLLVTIPLIGAGIYLAGAKGQK
jgi:hypothetical protein